MNGCVIKEPNSNTTEGSGYVDNTSDEKKEPLGYAEVYQVKDTLLMVEQAESENNNELILKRFSIEDNSFLEETRVSAGKDWVLQIGVQNIALLDYTKKQVRVLDEQLRVLKEYTIGEHYDQWYFDSEMEQLYLFDFQKGITVVDPEGGKEQVLLDNIDDMKVYGYEMFQVFFSYVDKESQETKDKVLELNSCVMETIPLSKRLSDVNHYEGVWFLEEDNLAKKQYFVVTEQKIKEVECEDGTLCLLGSKKHLLYIDKKNNLLSLYDLEGTFISRFVLEEDLEHSISSNFVWSGYRQGYYFTDTTKNGTSIKFWDPSVSSKGDNLIFVSEKDYTAEGMTITEMKKRAKALSDTFGVDIYLGDACLLDYSAYTAAVLDNASLILESLDALEQSLSKYPEGFMEQLQFGAITSIRIDLVASLKLKNSAENSIDAAAFAEEKHDYFLLVFDANQMEESTVYHEITHLIDKRLEWERLVKEDVLFSEEAWLELQPEGFDYLYSYNQEPEVLNEHYDERYFVSEYACTYPTEDRATMMEKAMMGFDAEFAEKPGLKEKLTYYSKCIRDCFDTQNWPNITQWEKTTTPQDFGFEEFSLFSKGYHHFKVNFGCFLLEIEYNK